MSTEAIFRLIYCLRDYHIHLSIHNPWRIVFTANDQHHGWSLLWLDTVVRVPCLRNCCGGLINQAFTWCYRIWSEDHSANASSLFVGPFESSHNFSAPLRDWAWCLKWFWELSLPPATCCPIVLYGWIYYVTIWGMSIHHQVSRSFTHSEKIKEVSWTNNSKKLKEGKKQRNSKRIPNVILDTLVWTEKSNHILSVHRTSGNGSRSRAPKKTWVSN